MTYRAIKWTVFTALFLTAPALLFLVQVVFFIAFFGAFVFAPVTRVRRAGRFPRSRRSFAVTIFAM